MLPQGKRRMREPRSRFALFATPRASAGAALLLLALAAPPAVGAGRAIYSFIGPDRVIHLTDAPPHPRYPPLPPDPRSRARAPPAADPAALGVRRPDRAHRTRARGRAGAREGRDRGRVELRSRGGVAEGRPGPDADHARDRDHPRGRGSAS